MNQTSILQKMSGEQRLEQAIQLSELSRELLKANIIEILGKEATKKRITGELRKRLWG